MGEPHPVRLLCSKRALLGFSPAPETKPAAESEGIRWLIGSRRFLPRFTIVSALRCLHRSTPADPFAPDFLREADDLKVLLPKGFDIVGALYICNKSYEENCRKAIEASRKMTKYLSNEEGGYMVGSAIDLLTGDIHFFASEYAENEMEVLGSIVYEGSPIEYLWNSGCLLRCELAFKLPIYFLANKISEAEEMFSSMISSVGAKLKDPHVVYLVEGSTGATPSPNSLAVKGAELDFSSGTSDCMHIESSGGEYKVKGFACSYFSNDNCISLSSTRKGADPIRVTVLTSFSRNSSKYSAPVAEYFPVSEPARLITVDFQLDVLCYASKNFSVASAISNLIVPGLIEQLDAMKKAIIPNLLSKHPQLSPYHFLPPGVLHPITAIYDNKYGETELKQGEARKHLHSRLGLPMDRPILLIANALTYGEKDSIKKYPSVSSLLRDVHNGVPNSGVAGGIMSLVDGSYEYYHYLLDGFDDSGWGCAYRSLQTIISWFRLQSYTSIEVPSHREIQKVLVEIGDKEPSFVGSREWIGAIELSFVLDKLLGTTCKVINVRSGEELPEKCRELLLHFETQGTPIMIGGGVLAYTLLGIDYNEASGDCAFLILDPHYTGTDGLKKIIAGGWCGWKKAVDSKGRSFFLKDKFYNLLLPQRPNMV